MTFPNTTKDSNQEMELMVRSSFSDPGSFFGLKSMCAAHRAVIERQRSGNWDSVLTNDPDYCMMRAKSIQEMSAKVRDPSRRLSNEAFDTIINLLTGSVWILSPNVGIQCCRANMSQLIIGEFTEVHTHLTGLKSMVDLRGGITDESIRSSSMLSAIITYVRFRVFLALYSESRSRLMKQNRHQSRLGPNDQTCFSINLGCTANPFGDPTANQTTGSVSSQQTRHRIFCQ